MITINNINQSEPYTIFNNLYLEAVDKDQPAVEAIAISSYNKNLSEIESRFVNLKYINNDQWIFFTNYNSPKASHFNTHQQIAALFYLSSTNTQIRIKAEISKTSKDFSDKHYHGRSLKKNALAHSSDQSSQIDSYEKVLDLYNKTLSNNNLLLNRPVYWGGFSFVPYYFEFWQGAEHRLNKRDVYEIKNNDWEHLIIQP